MKKIISLFKRDYEGDHKVYDEIVPGAEWVIRREGIATRKFDGTACMIREGRLYKRYDRKLQALLDISAGECILQGEEKPVQAGQKLALFKPAPEGWEPAEPGPDIHTGHWPGWTPVGDGPEDKYHREAFERLAYSGVVIDGTYELCGPKIQGNPEGLAEHVLIRHGVWPLDQVPTDFEGLKLYLANMDIEGVVWHRGNGDMVKIKKRDFGLPRHLTFVSE